LVDITDAENQQNEEWAKYQRKDQTGLAHDLGNFFAKE
jgi:hypothetical protein